MHKRSIDYLVMVIIVVMLVILLIWSKNTQMCQVIRLLGNSFHKTSIVYFVLLVIAVMWLILISVLKINKFAMLYGYKVIVCTGYPWTTCLLWLLQLFWLSWLYGRKYTNVPSYKVVR